MFIFVAATLLLAEYGESPPPSPMMRDCGGAALPVCPPGWSGPECDLPCREGDHCSTSLYCHSWGTTQGISTNNSYLFELNPAWPAFLISQLLRSYFVQRPTSYGLDSGLGARDIDISPTSDFRSNAGELAFFRFNQRYRGHRVFGPDGIVTLITNQEGAIGLRGAIVDARVQYDHIDNPATVASAKKSIQHYAWMTAETSTDKFEIENLQLVAVPRLQTIGWFGTARRPSSPLVYIVVEADPLASILPLIHLGGASADGLKDLVDIEVLAESFQSNFPALDKQMTLHAMLTGGGNIRGSKHEDLNLLATERVVAIDASDVVSETEVVAIQPWSEPDSKFEAEQGTQGFRAQAVYFGVQQYYTWADRTLSGQWESARPLMMKEPLIPQGQFEPRLVVYLDGLAKFCASPWCAGPGFNPSQVDPGALPDAWEHPLGGIDGEFETLGRMAFVGITVPNPEDIAHEFGHIIDTFARPGIMDHGLSCKPDPECPTACEEDTDDESSPLSQTFANLVYLWMMRDLYQIGADSSLVESCGLASQLGATFHNDTCRPAPKAPLFSLFLRPGSPGCESHACDKPSTPEPGAGLCIDEQGYHVDSFYEAFWEILHAETCATTPPFTCTKLPSLQTNPGGDLGGQALVYAARISTGSYQGFADDMATFVSCNYPNAYHDFNEILCHHRIRACDTPPPVVCEACNNGVREGGEQCDTADFADESCETQGFDTGALSCTNECKIDTSMCINSSTTSLDPTSSSHAGSSTLFEDPPETLPTGAGGATDPGSAASSSSSSPFGADELEDDDGCNCSADAHGRTGLSNLLFFALTWPLCRRRRA